MKIAIVYDWLDKWGGVERLLLILAEMYPNAWFYTSYFDPAKAAWAKNLNIKTSYIERMPDFIKKNRKSSIPFYPFAFESFDFSGYDLVISASSGFAKGIITRPPTKHICLLLTPTRYLWIHPDEYKTNTPWLKPYVKYLKKWDRIAAQRPDTIISISKTVQERAKVYYKRNSTVIYPPFDIRYWSDIKALMSNSKYQIKSKIQILDHDFFLIVSRLEAYKKVKLAIQTFNNLSNKRLIIVGTGSQLNELKNLAKSNIFFLADATDKELGLYYSNAQGLIMPQEEDFGLVALEAQFFGCPVISFRKGGALETVIENQTGIFFDKQTVDSLSDCINQYDKIKISIKKKMEVNGPINCQRFSKEEFITKIQNIL